MILKTKHKSTTLFAFAKTLRYTELILNSGKPYDKVFSCPPPTRGFVIL